MKKIKKYIVLNNPTINAAGLKTSIVDYKNVKLLKRFISETGKINPRKVAGLNGVEQRQICVAVKRARHLGLLPYISY